jgi:hypothetical protein
MTSSKQADRFVVWVEGDTQCLKRVTRLPVTDIVAQAPEGEPMSLDEINEIVHQRHPHYHRARVF